MAEIKKSRKTTSKKQSKDNNKTDFSSYNRNKGLLSFVKYDAATINDLTREMFVNCDSRSADASNQPLIRSRIREFARKEVANNSYARGLTLIVSSDMIGRGPRLQLEDDLGCNESIEAEFNNWADEIQLSEKLRTGKIAKMVDGETFGVFYRDKKLKSSSKLNFKLLESDQIANPYNVININDEVDGMDLDENGDPTYYYILKDHPGNMYSKYIMEYTKVNADSVCHWFRQDRPGQHRGVSEFAPALSMFYMLRRYTLATVEAAEIAANFPMVLYTDSNAIQDVQINNDPFCEIGLAPGKLTALPEAWKLGQVHAEQPTTSYPDFKRELLAEVARCFSVPVNVISGDSSKHNYASGRLDYQVYHKSLDVERKTCEVQVLDKLFERWYEETYIKNVSPRYWISNKIPKATWFWDGFPHVDPVKEANAQQTRLANMTTSLSRECAKQGVDWVVMLKQIARENALKKELGLPVFTNNDQQGTVVDDE